MLEGVMNGGGVMKDAASLPARMALGASMLYHGTGKLRAEGREQTSQFMESVGITPGRGWAVATGVAETVAGVLAVAGIATRPAALAVLVTQGVAVWRVHSRNGFDITKGGYEYNLALMAIALGLLVAGPGRFSAHEAAEELSYGRGRARRALRRVRPGSFTRALKWLK
ncbi:MAG TPA: DoxX family protein [Anaeromyxobacteraceae bacterium]|jgi:putative oxidoreductase|nr:DoxX family protein [Anaeromyxobacteraceae bacterium]